MIRRYILSLGLTILAFVAAPYAQVAAPGAPTTQTLRRGVDTAQGQAIPPEDRKSVV